MTTRAAQEYPDPTAPRAIATLGPRPPVGSIVRAMDAPAGELAVGTLVRYGSLVAPDAGIPYVEPLGGGQCWQGCAEYLRPARPEEIARARGGES